MTILPHDFFTEEEKAFIQKCRDNTRCLYCGSTKEVRDHFLPVCFLTPWGRSYKDKNNIVPACHECNSLKGSKIFFEINEVRQFLQDRIAKKYKSTLDFPYWTPEELRKVSPRLRRSIKVRMLAREWVMERLAWPNIDFQETSCSQEKFEKAMALLS